MLEADRLSYVVKELPDTLAEREWRLLPRARRCRASDRRGGRCGDRPPRRRGSAAHHPPPRLLAPVPSAALRARAADPVPRRTSARRAGRAARATPSGRLLLGRLFAEQHAVPPRRQCAGRIHRRRRDRRALPIAHRRPASARPADRHGERGRRSARPADRWPARRRYRSGGHRPVDRDRVRRAVGGTHRRRRVQRRRDVSRRSAPAPFARPRLRRRGIGSHQRRWRDPPAPRATRGRARVPPAAPPVAHRPPGRGEPGAAVC